MRLLGNLMSKRLKKISRRKKSNKQISNNLTTWQIHLTMLPIITMLNPHKINIFLKTKKPAIKNYWKNAMSKIRPLVFKKQKFLLYRLNWKILSDSYIGKTMKLKKIKLIKAENLVLMKLPRNLMIRLVSLMFKSAN